MATYVSDRIQLKDSQGDLQNIKIGIPSSRVYLDTVGNSAETLDTLIAGTSSKVGNYRIVDATVNNVMIQPQIGYKTGDSTTKVTLNYLYYTEATLYNCSISGVVTENSNSTYTFTYDYGMITSIADSGIISIVSYIASKSDTLPTELIPTITSVKGAIL